MTAANPLGGSSRLAQLLTRMEKLLTERYAFDVFAEDSINFGIMVTYRQTWEPQNYQVGDLVKTIPLAPKEVRRYTTRTVTKKTRAQKEIEDNLQTRKTESSDTTRVDDEIVKKAQEKTNFNLAAKETFGGEGMSTSTRRRAAAATQQGVGADEEGLPRERAEERTGVPQQHRMEVDISESTETEETTFHEIQNPNDELAVTYLFYELQRHVPDQRALHKLTPVILVANDVPAPNEIDDAWLVEHDWILRRVDPRRLVPAGARLPDEELRRRRGQHPDPRGATPKAQKQLVDNINQQIQAQIGDPGRGRAERRGRRREARRRARSSRAVRHRQADLRPDRHHRRRPTPARRRRAGDGRLREGDASTAPNARGPGCWRSWTSRVTRAAGGRRQAVSAVKEHYDHVAEIDRLRVHVKDNILYYMQAIWRHEPPDQRFFRLYDIDVPIVTAGPTPACTVDVAAPGAGVADRARSGRGKTAVGHAADARRDGDDEEAGRGRRPRQRARLQGQLHGLRR